MTFDHAYKPNRDNLSPAIAAMMDRVFYARRAQGLNVQFINEAGRKDEWSMESAERAQALFAKLTKQGREAVLSN